jgi:hypothetical protein
MMEYDDDDDDDDDDCLISASDEETLLQWGLALVEALGGVVANGERPAD